MTNEHDVVNFLKAIEKNNVTVWIGGGWGVDALIGFQSRPHNDIDLYTERKNSGAFLEILTTKGYSEIETEYTTESHTVWQDSSSRTVDLHLFEFVGTDALHFEGEDYPSNVLHGEGTIGGFAVRCFTADAQLLFHQGYEHGEKDVHDVLLLCKTFGFEIPAEYKNMKWNELFDREKEPSEIQIREYVNTPIFDDLDGYLQQTYKVKPKRAYSNCNMDNGMWKGWNVKYQKSGKSLCTLYPKQGHLQLLVPVGAREMSEAELLIPLCTEYTQELWKRSGGADYKSMAFEVRDDSVLHDVKSLIDIRVKTK
jgi:lincosamide nucleotidyltransferase A/C/D/E